MPFANEHSVRLIDPNLPHIAIRRTKGRGAVQGAEVPSDVAVIWYVVKRRGKGVPIAQAMRFPVSGWSSAKVKTWLRSNDIKHVSFEPAASTTKKASLQTKDPLKTNNKIGIAMPSQCAFVSTSKVSNDPDHDNKKTQFFLKDMMSVGCYVHPKDGWKLNATRQRMDNWVANFKLMKSRGIDVPFVIDHREDAEALRGYVVDMYRQDDTLYGLHKIIGEDAIALAERCKNVSLLIEPNYKDGLGNTYNEAIIHNSIVQKPVVPGQGSFVKIAASQDGSGSKEVPLLILKENIMLSKEELKELSILLGMDEKEKGLTEDTMLSSVTSFVESIQDENQELTTKVEELEKTPVKNDNNQVKEVDADVLEDRAETAAEQIESLVGASKITPKVAASLKLTLIGDKGKFNSFCLSRRLSNTPTSIVKAVVEALKENDPIKLGEKTPAQLMELSLNTDTTDDEDKAVTKEMVEQAGGAANKK